MTATVGTNPLDRTVIRARVDNALYEFLERKTRAGTASGLPGDVTDAVRSFLFAGGKRIRPLLCAFGWHAAGGGELPNEIIRAAAALEMFHAAVLIHDDIIDNSDTRRDQPTVHRAAADRNRTARDAAAADLFGTSAAILIGDFALVWSDELLHTAGLSAEQLAAAAPVLDAMRSEVNYGQYLDLLTTGHPTADLDQALEIIRYKTAAYTVERPLQLGAVLAGAGSDVCEALSAYARPLGEAFQLQDDLLGVFGDPARTGKSIVDDLREGKHTALLALALRNADADQAARLRGLVGNRRLDERGAAICREILAVTARTEVEQLIRERWLRVQRALDKAPFPAAAIAALRATADAIVARAS